MGSAKFSNRGVEDWSDALRRFGHCFRRTDLADTAGDAGDSRFRAEAVDREVLRINGEFQDGLSAGLRRWGQRKDRKNGRTDRTGNG